MKHPRISDGAIADRNFELSVDGRTCCLIAGMMVLPALPSRLESALIGVIGKSTSSQTGGLSGSLKSGTGRRIALPRLGGS